ncbi:hypothetical protein BV22DRAFT_1198227 [Leucogyrophana mollusca]|uniref:Uncharacterized protein n=1 Tax=Leucogyrophana mollusca TaxID=85980 RepID=A0ACB8B7G3_9AGAM|nr:hypothetical protein BV22DRAFT_1198227 [Leucogyrophana mollusca]
MADSIPESWICPYLIDAAETHGGNLHDILIWTKKKKAQLIDFLTYQEDDYIWGLISDKAHRIPVRFTKEATAAYRSQSQGRRLTENRNAVIFIRDFRPTFTRIPVGNNVPRLTANAHLALEVGYIAVLAPDCGYMFGNPQALDTNNKLKLWAEGLRQHGGGGNILKLSKEQEQAASPAKEAQIATESRNRQPSPSRVPSKPAQQAKSKIKSAAPARSDALIRQGSDPMRERIKSWRPYQLDPWAYIKPVGAEEEPQLMNNVPDVVRPSSPRQRNALSPPVTPDLPRTPLTPRRTPSHELPVPEQTTPRTSEWSPSIRGSRRASPAPLDDDVTAPERDNIDEPEQDADTSSLLAPTPAQRVIPPSDLPKSSPPPSSSLPLALPSSLPLPVRKIVKRKVPHPGHPPPRSDPNVSGPGQILVPNSDTSGMASQPSQSQSQSQSQPLPRSQPKLPTSSVKPTDASNLMSMGPPRLARTASRIGVEPLLSQADSQYDGDTSSLAFSRPELEQQSNTLSRKDSSPKDPQRASSSVPPICVLHDENDTGSVVDESEVDELDQPAGDPPNTRRDDELSEDDAETHDLLRQHTSQGNIIHGARKMATPRTHPSSSTKNVRPSSPAASERSPSPLYSLFSQSPGVEPAVQTCDTLPHVVPTPQREPVPSSSRLRSPSAPTTNVLAREHIAPEEHAIIHDAEAWKRPSFMTMGKGKGKATPQEVLEQAGRKGGNKRRLSHHPSSSPSASPKKKLKVLEEEPPASLRVTPRGGATTGKSSGHVQQSGSMRNSDALNDKSTDASGSQPYKASRKKASRTNGEDVANSSHAPRPSQEVSISSISTPSGRRRRANLAGFVVDFERIPTPPGVQRMSWMDIQKVLLRTGRIRTLGDEVEADGSVYLTSD